MQPEFSPQPRSTEQMPQVVPSFEVLPQLSPERESTSHERQEPTAPERRDQLPAPVVPAAPLPSIPAPVASTQVADATLNPIAATDDDTIEKEWVDRTKQIIEQTKNDPYTRERALGELQRDYLMKRYGKQVGQAS